MSDTVLPTDLHAALANEEPLVLLDVREADELALAQIEGVVHVPLADVAARASSLDSSASFVVICAVGGRARRAQTTLRDLGFSRVRVLEGGMMAWLAGGHPATGSAVPSADVAARYDRQMRLPEVGPEGQAKLLAAKVAIVGAGGLGCPLLLYLAAAGVGHLTVIDFDHVALHNLHRQVLYGTADVGRPKVLAAKDAIARSNPSLVVTAVEARLHEENTRELLSGSHVLVDATDSFAARYAVNRASCMLSIPAVFGAVSRFSGEVLTRVPESACYACLHPTAPGPGLAPTCAEEGVLGVVPGIVGLLQANEVLKLLLGYGVPLASKLLTFDARSTTFRALALPRDPACAACGS